MSIVYSYPHYYALAYRWNTEEECDFVEACLQRWDVQPSTRLLDLGCGTGRHALELAARGYEVTGIDPTTEMIAYAREQAELRSLAATFNTGSLEQFTASGLYAAAFCFMDTFRFLLTDDAIIRHLQQVASCVQPGGMYLIDFWAPRAATLPPDETYEWEQRSETTHVRVQYAQYPASWDAASRTFDDELVLHVHEDGEERVIRGGRTRTRLLLPEEFTALVQRAGGWRLIGQFDGFDLQRPYRQPASSWRMVSILQKAK